MRQFAPHTTQTIGRLLVVDDDLVQRTIIGKIGAKLGYDTISASSFEVAARLLQEEQFDVMTLDLSLGEHDGVELLRIVANRELKSMSVVVISGCDGRIVNSTRRVAEGLEIPLTASLSKPLNLDQLRDALLMPVKGRAEARVAKRAPAITRERMLSGFEHKEFFVEFQPKVALASGAVIGAEALARWSTSEFGIVSPVDFVLAAEQFGLMPELTEQVLNSALSQARNLIERYPGFTVAVNLSGSLMSDLSLPERVEAVLHRENVPPQCLIVEITETSAMADVDRAMDVLVRLRIKNIGAAIDDFGTGYSSLSALARLPFNELKIDQSFVKGCESDEDLIKIIDGSVGLARAFNMKVVAEGIDTVQTLARVKQAGCDIGQGYLFAPSLRADHATRWISRRNAFAEYNASSSSRSGLG